jgi:heme/copper-type cytochrome/quinol oxidase subunit 3
MTSMSSGAVIALALGVGFIALALYEFAANRAFLRFDFVRKDNEPGVFWFLVAVKVALGTFIIFTATWRPIRAFFAF